MALSIWGNCIRVDISQFSSTTTNIFYQILYQYLGNLFCFSFAGIFNRIFSVIFTTALFFRVHKPPHRRWEASASCYQYQCMILAFFLMLAIVWTKCFPRSTCHYVPMVPDKSCPSPLLCFKMTHQEILQRTTLMNKHRDTRNHWWISIKITRQLEVDLPGEKMLWYCDALFHSARGLRWNIWFTVWVNYICMYLV